MTTKQRRNGIQWTLWSQLDDLDFADDLALLSHNRHQLQDKTTRLMDIFVQVSLRIHKQKSKVMKVNTASTEPVLLESSPLEEVESFTYLGSIINVQGGTMSRLVLTRAGQLSYNFRQFGNPENCPNAPRSGFSIQMLSKFYFMLQRHEG